MPKTRHYPPSQIRYQMEHPSVTVHLSKKVKENIDKIKQNRSYAQVISEILNGTFDMEEEVKQLPTLEAVISYVRGFREAEGRYARFGVCSKCHKESILWNDGKCILCHKQGAGPDFSFFREKEVASVVNDEDFDKAKVKLPPLEKLVYENGRASGYEEGWSDGFDEAVEDYKITYPCSVCGKPIEMMSGDNDHKAMIGYMKEKGWAHKKCFNANDT